jgi:hypothetical protein
MRGQATSKASMMRGIVAFAFLAGTLLFLPPLAAQAATVIAKVDLSRQTMTVTHRGRVKYNWKVSTGTMFYSTPVGSYRAQWLSKDHKSKQYFDAPMPYSIFFHRGYAIHGTPHESRLGSRASHGCIRLTTSNARILYDMAEREGLGNFQVVIVDSKRGGTDKGLARRKSKTSVYMADVNKRSPMEDSYR